jgi:hypothetical protein
MSDMYLQFCVELAISDDGIKKAQQFCDWLDTYANNCDIDDDDLTDSSILPEFLLYRDTLLAKVRGQACVGFDIDYDRAESDGKCLYVTSNDDGWGDPQQAAMFIQVLLRHCDVELPEAAPYVVLSWAESCSRTQPYGFYGGCALITRDNLIYKPSDEAWAAKKYRKFVSKSCIKS